MSKSTAKIDRSSLKRIGVLYEDDDLLAVSKPPGMSVHGGAAERGRTLIDILAAAYAPGIDLHLVHRLDRGTSGAIVVAKSREAARRVGEAWDRAEKVYLAIALGLLGGAFEIMEPLTDRHGREQSALTRVRAIAELTRIEPATTLLSIDLGTGRTHQIRRHLASSGHPVMMDDQHGDFRANKRWSAAVAAAGAKRAKHLMLHSLRLALPQPFSRSVLVRVVAEPPEQWSKILLASGGTVDGLGILP